MQLEELNIALFDGLDASERESVFQLATTGAYQDGTVIIQEGDPGRGFFLLLEGTVSIDKQTIEGTPETLAILEPGECFGEMALVDHKPRSATCTAVGPVEVLLFEQRALDQFFLESPAIHLKIVENLVQITSGPDFLTRPSFRLRTTVLLRSTHRSGF